MALRNLPSFSWHPGILLSMLLLAANGAAAARAGVSAKPAGAAVCIECHAAQVEKWTGSHHDLAMQKVTEKTVLGDFADATSTHHGITTAFYRKGGNFMVHTEGAVSVSDAMAESGQPTYVCPAYGAPMIIIETFARGQMIRAPPQLRGAA